MAKEPAIVIPIGDWAEEYQEMEPNLSTENEMISTHRKEGLKPQQMGRLLAMAKVRDEAAEAVPEAKPMLNVGYASWFSRFLANHRVEVEMPNGQKYAVREYVGPVQEPHAKGDSGGTFDEDGPPAYTDDEPAFVSWDDNLAVSRATDYLLKRVTGYIMSRLKLIAAKEGDVKGVAESLHDEIDRMVGMLV